MTKLVVGKVCVMASLCNHYCITWSKPCFVLVNCT